MARLRRKRENCRGRKNAETRSERRARARIGEGSAGRAFGFAADVRAGSVARADFFRRRESAGRVAAEPGRRGGAFVGAVAERLHPRREEAFRFLSPPGESPGAGRGQAAGKRAQTGEEHARGSPSLPASGREKRRLCATQAASGAGCVRPQARRRRANRSPAPSECCSRRAGP